MALEQEISKGIMEGYEGQGYRTSYDVAQREEVYYRGEDRFGGYHRIVRCEVLKIIAKLAKQGAESAAVYAQQNRPDLAAEESAQVAVLQTFLPKQMTGEELTEAVRSIIAEVGATSMKEMGKVMGVASKKLAGMADGKDISAKVKELLS